jgi:flagellar motility protein MotE (MotC chaperone)
MGPGFSSQRLDWRYMGDVERRIETERARVAAEYREVLKSSVEFERRIRDRWRQKCLAKNQRIAELEERIADLERRFGEREDL